MNNILISYPKSSSDWIRYITEFIYQRPTSDEFTSDKKSKIKQVESKIGSKIINIDINKNPILVKKHYINNRLNEKDRCIISLRNPIEVVISFNYAQYIQKVKNIEIENYINENYNKLGNEMSKWNNNLKFFEKHTGDKHIISYKNLMNNPKDEIESLLEFIGEYKEERKNYFFEYIDEHSKNCINYKKHKSHMPNITFGMKKKFNYSMLSEEQKNYLLQFIDNELIKKYESKW